MLSHDRVNMLAKIDSFSFENILILNCLLNEIEVPARSITLKVNEAQKRLLLCLLNQINYKQDIINIVWCDNYRRMRNNNYHQLIFQTRHLFRCHGLPEQLLVTLPYYGIKLDEPLLRSFATAESGHSAS